MNIAPAFKTNLDKLILKTFNIKPQEKSKFLLLFFHSFFVGLFIAFYFVQANSAFISRYGSDKLPIAYMIAGLVGYLISTLYSYLQKKIKSKYLFAGALAFMLITALLARAAYGYTDDKYLSFFVFVWAWPFISLAATEAGGLAIRLLNLIQVKRLFGLINMGGVIASILGYLVIPIISKYQSTSYNLLAFGAISLVAALVLLFLIFKKSPEKKQVKVSKSENNTGFRHLLKNRYYKLIFISATLSMTVIYIADFGFLSSIKVQHTLFPDEESVAAFLALVFAGLKIGEFVISYFSSRILSRFGVRLGLLIMPVTLTLITFAALIVGFTAGTATLLFLALMTLNKSMERILRRGLDDPAFNTLYQPLPSSKQLAVQSKVGVVMQFAIAIAGVLLFTMSELLKVNGEFRLEFYPLFFIPLLLLWTYVAYNLYMGYKRKLRELLKELSKKQRRDTSKYQYGTEVLTKKFKKFNQNVVRLSVAILSETNPRLFEPYAASLMKNDDPQIRKSVLRSIDPSWRERTKKFTEKIAPKEKDPEIKSLAEKVNQYLDFNDITGLSPKDIENIQAESDKASELTLVKYLIKNKNAKNAEAILSKLFESKNRTVIHSAIRIAVNIKTPELIATVVELIKSPAYYQVAAAAVLDIGEKAIPYIDDLFKRTENKNILLKIIEIYAKMGTASAKSLLVSNINYPDREIQLAAIWALYYCKYQAPEEEEEPIKDKINQTIDNLLWILATIRDIEHEKNTLKLFLALDQERENNYELLFNLLSFLHDPRIINLIKKNIIGKNTIYALELIDNFINPDLKSVIVAIFDDLSVNQKIKKLSKYFPQNRMSFRKRLKEIVMRDFEKIDGWTVTKTLEMMDKIHRKKTATIKSYNEETVFKDVKIWKRENLKDVLAHIRRSELPDEVFLSLFHPNELIYSTAAKIIYQENPAKCFDYLNRMSPHKKRLVSELSENGYLIQDKIKLLRKYQLFFSIPDFLLVNLAELVVPQKPDKDEKIYFNTEDGEQLVILIKGALIAEEGSGDTKEFKRKVIISPGMNVEQDCEHLTATRKSVVLTVNRHKYFNMLVDNTGILQEIFEVIQK